MSTTATPLNATEQALLQTLLAKAGITPDVLAKATTPKTPENPRIAELRTALENTDEAIKSWQTIASDAKQKLSDAKKLRGEIVEDLRKLGVVNVKAPGSYLKDDETVPATSSQTWTLFQRARAAGQSKALKELSSGDTRNLIPLGLKYNQASRWIDRMIDEPASVMAEITAFVKGEVQATQVTPATPDPKVSRNWKDADYCIVTKEGKTEFINHGDYKDARAMSTKFSRLIGITVRELLGVDVVTGMTKVHDGHTVVVL